ncbi:SDR family NAD(P)-dependent oxidoreductase [Phaeovulum sp.]|uniref:SDR family NAD(P)-dependent oxidoreductase n=1 Tax=Phaeovulum sp. TaxID=2934796 RepID=UPI002731B34B|nr:SDR family NAD(P)-dependent oxidoreductase [Phaeovulum sp.]MDP1669370.1 SDR family NAD(P)-dependent oxidoreductase [Phaeovulum sp.]MDZ4119646.1 SDR family NAD(P)-dependent oxidoreductase [Phaeovulum sp.]
MKTILITGCSSGIGYDAAHGLKRAGWRVFATCRAEADCARLHAEGLESFPLDVDDSDSIASGVAEVVARTGGTLDALYNNAAFACPGAVEDLPRGALREIFETNLFGLHELTCRVIPMMRAQGHGRIVNCSSVLGIVGIRWRGAYAASKFALEGLTDILRLEMSDTPIRVILIEPGPIASRIRANSIPHFEHWIDWRNSPRRAEYEAKLLKRLYQGGKPDRWQLPPAAVTAKILRALESPNPKPRYYVTTPTWVSGIARRLLSTRMLDRLLGRG